MQYIEVLFPVIQVLPRSSNSVNLVILLKEGLWCQFSFYTKWKHLNGDTTCLGCSSFSKGLLEESLAMLTQLASSWLDFNLLLMSLTWCHAESQITWLLLKDIIVICCYCWVYFSWISCGATLLNIQFSGPRPSYYIFRIWWQWWVKTTLDLYTYKNPSLHLQAVLIPNWILF